MRLSRLSTVKRKILAHNANGFSPTCLQIFRAMNGVPKFPHISAGQSVRPRVVEIHESYHRTILLALVSCVLISTKKAALLSVIPAQAGI